MITKSIAGAQPVLARREPARPGSRRDAVQDRGRSGNAGETAPRTYRIDRLSRRSAGGKFCRRKTRSSNPTRNTSKLFARSLKETMESREGVAYLLRAAGFDVRTEEINLSPELRWKRGVPGAFGRSCKGGRVGRRSASLKSHISVRPPGQLPKIPACLTGVCLLKNRRHSDAYRLAHRGRR